MNSISQGVSFNDQKVFHLKKLPALGKSFKSKVDGDRTKEEFVLMQLSKELVNVTGQVSPRNYNEIFKYSDREQWYEAYKTRLMLWNKLVR